MNARALLESRVNTIAEIRSNAKYTADTHNRMLKGRMFCHPLHCIAAATTGTLAATVKNSVRAGVFTGLLTLGASALFRYTTTYRAKNRWNTLEAESRSLLRTWATRLSKSKTPSIITETERRQYSHEFRSVYKQYGDLREMWYSLTDNDAYFTTEAELDGQHDMGIFSTELQTMFDTTNTGIRVLPQNYGACFVSHTCEFHPKVSSKSSAITAQVLPGRR